MISTSLAQAYAELARLHLNKETAQTAVAIRTKNRRIDDQSF